MSEETVVKKSYRAVEIERWETVVRPSCEAQINDMWINNHCRIRDNKCCFEHCLAVRIIKLAKGFL